MTAPLSVVALSAQLHPNSESHASAGKTDGECGRQSMLSHHRATHKSHIRAQYQKLFQGTFVRNYILFNILFFISGHFCEKLYFI